MPEKDTGKKVIYLSSLFVVIKGISLIYQEDHNGEDNIKINEKFFAIS